MRLSDPFDEKIDQYNRGSNFVRCPEGIIDAAVFVNDTLELCMASAKSVFGDEVAAETVFAIYDRILAKMQMSTDTSNET